MSRQRSAWRFSNCSRREERLTCFVEPADSPPCFGRSCLTFSGIARRSKRHWLHRPDLNLSFDCRDSISQAQSKRQTSCPKRTCTFTHNEETVKELGLDRVEQQMENCSRIRLQGPGDRGEIGSGGGAAHDLQPGRLVVSEATRH